MTLDSLFSISTTRLPILITWLFGILYSDWSITAAMLYNCSLIICASIILTEYFKSNQYFMFMYLFEKRTFEIIVLLDSTGFQNRDILQVYILHKVMHMHC